MVKRKRFSPQRHREPLDLFSKKQGHCDQRATRNIVSILNPHIATHEIFDENSEYLLNWLKQEKKDAGVHEIIWNAQGLSSGIYLYRLETEQYSATRKLVFTK